MTLDEMKEYVRGKNVILVGNSLDAFEKNHGDFIDGHDVVVRFGKGLTDGIVADKIGSRTDIWVTGQLRMQTVRFVNKSTHILFNESLYNHEIGRPTVPHLSLYTQAEIDAIAAEYNLPEAKRLSAGAITGHWFYNVCNTWNTLTFKNFDVFTKALKFKTSHSVDISDGVQYTGSWHLPLLRKETIDPNYSIEDGNPAHDTATEVAMYQDLLQDGNVIWSGEPPAVKTQELKQDALVLWTRGRARIEEE